MAIRRTPESSSDLLIEVRDMTKVYGTGEMAVYALRGVSLEVRRGEFVAIMGPSGSGKSTFMHLLGCLDRPTAGSYRLAGQEVSRLSADELAVVRSRQIGFVFQSFNLLARSSALENVELPMLYAGIPRDTRMTRAKELLTSVGLGNRLDHKPSELSGGQQQRVAIARSLANGVPLLTADEPTGNLDSTSSAEIMTLCRRLNEQQGLTVVLVTHDMGVAAWSKRVVTFRDGRIVSDKPVADAVPEALRAGVDQAHAAVREGAPV